MSDIELTIQQQVAVEFGEGPLLIVAGAGTGKTLVITQRIAHLIHSGVVRPEEILAVTFTEKAAAEMAERVDVLLPYGFANVHISTFHAFGDRILREFGLEIGLNPDFQVLSQPEQIIFFREHLFEFPLKHYCPLSDPTRFIQAMLTVISRAKDEDVSPETFRQYVQNLRKKGKVHPDDAGFSEEIERQEEVAAMYSMYQELMAREGKVDFGDQVSLVLRLFRERATVLKRVQERYRFILVDEFQDTNYAQFQLIQLLGGQKANITVVGDDDQSIYKFRGAAISNILSFMDVYPQAKQVVLTENFRSSQIILDTAYRLIQNNNPDRLEVRNQIDKRLKAQSKGAHPVEHFHCDSLPTEADRVAQIIHDLVANKGCQYGDIAILVRTNGNADPFLRSMNLKGIPWRFSGSRGLYSQAEVQLLMAFLRVIADPEDTVSLYHLATTDVYELMSMEDLQRCVNLAHRKNVSLYSVLKQIEEVDELQDISADTRSTIPKIIEDIGTYLDLSRDNITGVVLYQFLTNTRYFKRLTHDETPENSLKIQNIARFFDVIWAFAQVAREDRVIHFVRYLDMLIESGDDPGTAEADPDRDAVNVLTVHKAKGLEWPVVFIVSLIDKQFPHTRRKEPIELPTELVNEILPEGDFHLQEERRLFYVGMTRARERLLFTSAQDYGGMRKRKVSPFVLESLDRPHLDEVNVRSDAQERIQRFAPPPDGVIRTMAPIPGDAVHHLSYYQVDDYQTCPLKYKYVHILHLPFFHHTIVYGKAVHSAIECYYRHIINGSPVTLDDLYRAFERAWRSIGFLSKEHHDRRKKAGKESIRRFFEEQQKSGIVPKLVEEKFSFLIEKNRMVGRWDRIDERDGEIAIVDFKSSEIHTQEAATRRVKNSLQLNIYAMAYARTFDRMPDVLELHFLESGLVGQTNVTDKMFAKTEEVILQAAQGIRSRDYTAKPSYQSCKYCAYTDVCPSAVRF